MDRILPTAVLLIGVLLGACQPGTTAPPGGVLSLIGWISVVADSVSLDDGSSVQVHVEVFSPDGKVITAIVPPSWSVVPDSIATVSASGLVTSQRPGAGLLEVRLGTATAGVPLRVAPVATALEATSPTLDGGRPSEPAPSTVSVRVLDRHGTGVSGVMVHFGPDSTSGSIVPSAVISDVSGSAKAAWTLGPEQGPQRVHVYAAGLDSVWFTVVAVPNLETLSLLSGNAQIGEVAKPLPDLLEVAVRDGDGFPVANVPIRWEAGEGGLVSDSTSFTDSQGRSRIQWILGTTQGPQTARGTIGNLTAEFNATGIAGPAAALVTIPDSASILGGDSIRFTAIVRDAHGNTISDPDVDWVTGNPTDSVGGAARDDGWLIAGYQPGTFRMVATSTSTGVADTSLVFVLENGQANTPPVGAFTSLCTEMTCALDATSSSDSDGSIVAWAWDFGDQSTGTGPNPAHTYPSVGSYIATLTVMDDRGAEGTFSASVEVAPEGPSYWVFPGMDLSAMVAAHPPRTVFSIRQGVHKRHQVTPRTGDQFVGEPGAVLDGEGVTPFAFYGTTGIDSVQIRGIEIRNYNPPPTEGAVRAENTHGWLIEDNEIHLNTGGVRVGQGVRILNNAIHHNYQLGIMGQADDILIEGNDIGYNNFTSAYDVFWAAGGIKITRSTDPVIRGNTVHHNTGPGIWIDINDLRAIVEDNTVTDNSRAGIYHEISYDGIIRNNQIFRNGGPNQWFHTGGIVVAASRNVEVYGNTLADNVHGIIGTQQARGSGTYGTYLLQNLWVHDNDVSMTQGFTGVVRDQSVGNQVFTSRGNRFDRNQYTLGGGAVYFLWAKEELNETGWQAAGHDANGTFSR